MRRQRETYFEELGSRFEQFASDYDADARARMIQRLLGDVELPLHSMALEVGCGFGAITGHLQEWGIRTVVSDIGENLVRRVSVTFDSPGVVADALGLPFEDGTFQLVVSSETIEHVPDPLQAAQEMMRVVQPGGYLLITSPNPLWGPVVTLAESLGLRQFEGNEVFVSSFRVAASLKPFVASRAVITGCHLFPWQIPGAKSILGRIDLLGKFLHPLMINWGLLLRKKSLHLPYN